MNAEAKPLDIEERAFQFALRVIRLCEELGQHPGARRAVSHQLIKSGTSIGANVEEARAAYSRADFASKMSIALKEARETRYWIRLARDSKFVDPSRIDPLLDEATQIMKILGAITAKVHPRAD